MLFYNLSKNKASQIKGNGQGARLIIKGQHPIIYGRILRNEFSLSVYKKNRILIEGDNETKFQ